ncbi:unnamed protein product [Acanthoscelides obtectus]|uniref:Coiled-coil domain-containing protein 13 n=2 Tax=Acanthoscelides obtectus TaxID=200917 RepID=A0A9P0LY30_ACAOB|nr:unnamed protein product [Acanthoscelides obtectus]CAK1672559.1 Coiled-coil domain-containing protein 13 [Acanthoscelides obtectus]
MESDTLKCAQNDLSDAYFPNIPEDIIFPDELNRYLRDQIRYYVQENSMLKKNLENLELEYNDCKSLLREMEKKLKRCTEVEKFVPTSQVTSIKIVELSKKLREKSCEFESLKTEYSKLEYELFKLQNQDDIPEVQPVLEQVATHELEEQIKKLQEKLNATQSKLSEANNMNLQLKNDLKLATKYLQQEIGDTFESLHIFTSNAGNWRGRAQVIHDLQQKNSDLKEKLKNTQEKFSTGGTEGNISLTKMESKISMLSKENSDWKSKCDGLKRKYEASQARIKSLESDCAILRTKYSMLHQQTDRDQDIISTLSAQISNSRNSSETVVNHKDRTINKLQNEKEQLLKEIEQYKSIISSLKKELDGEKHDIEDTKEINNAATGDDQVTNKVLDLLKKEKHQLLELLGKQNERLHAEREAHAKTQALLRLEKQRLLKTETLATLESRSSSYSLHSYTRPLDQNLKYQLELAEENIKALKTRLEMEQFERKQDVEEFAKLLKLDNKE